MRRLRLAAALIAALAVPLLAAAGERAAPPAPPAPRISFEQKEIDFGKVVVGTTVERSFKFKNTGTAALQVRRVKPSCGCTAALTSKAELPPGEAGEISARFESADRHGFQKIEVLVFSNDTAEKDAGDCASVLTLRGEVANLLDVMPYSFYFPAFLRGAKTGDAEKRITVLPTDQPAVRALSVEAPRPWLRVRTAPYERGPRKGFELICTIADDAPLGAFDERIAVRTDHPRQPVLKLGAFGAVHGKIVAFPDRLQIGQPSEREPAIQLMRVAGEGPIAIDGIEAPSALSAEPVEVVPGRRAEIALKLKKGAPRGPFAGVVRIFLRDPEQPLIEIHVTGDLPRTVRAEPPGAWLEAPSATAAVVRLHGGKAREVKVEHAPVTAALEDGGTRVRIALAPGAPAGPFAGAVRVKTDVEGEEEIEVPVRGRN